MGKKEIKNKTKAKNKTYITLYPMPIVPNQTLTQLNSAKTNPEST